MDVKKIVEVGAIILGGIFLYELLSSAGTAAQTAATTTANDQAATTQAQISSAENIAYANDGASLLGSLFGANSPITTALNGASGTSLGTVDLSQDLADNNAGIAAAASSFTPSLNFGDIGAGL